MKLQGHKIQEYINEHYIEFFEENGNVIEEGNALWNVFVKRIGYVLSIQGKRIK